MKNMKLYYKENHSYNKTNYDSTYYTLDSMYSLENLIKERETYRHQTILRDFKPGAYEVAQDTDNKLIIYRRWLHRSETQVLLFPKR